MVTIKDNRKEEQKLCENKYDRDEVRGGGLPQEKD